MKTNENFVVVTGNGTFRRVRSYGNFTAQIGGEAHEFAVTDELNAVGQCLTHVRSRLRVKPLGVGAAYLPGMRKLGWAQHIERGRLALQALIDLRGAEHILKVLNEAPATQIPKQTADGLPLR